MNNTIKRFKLKDGVTIEALRNGGCTDGGTHVNENAIIGDHLWGAVDSIDFDVAFPADLTLWNDFDYVLVLDDDFGQPFTPFYEYLNDCCQLYPFLEKVVNAYNTWMKSRWYLQEITEN